jgi:hypothetical protein
VVLTVPLLISFKSIWLLNIFIREEDDDDDDDDDDDYLTG